MPGAVDQLACFASLGFRAIAPDMRGYGRSSVYPKHEDYALANTVHDIHERFRGSGHIAKHLADEGAAVVVNYSSSKQGAERVVAEITSKAGRAIAVQADVSKPADLKRLFAETKKALGRLDVLVNKTTKKPTSTGHQREASPRFKPGTAPGTASTLFLLGHFDSVESFSTPMSLTGIKGCSSCKLRWRLAFFGPCRCIYM